MRACVCVETIVLPVVACTDAVMCAAVRYGALRRNTPPSVTHLTRAYAHTPTHHHLRPGSGPAQANHGTLPRSQTPDNMPSTSSERTRQDHSLHGTVRPTEMHNRTPSATPSMAPPSQRMRSPVPGPSEFAGGPAVTLRWCWRWRWRELVLLCT